MELNYLVKEVIEIARAAGTIIMQVYNEYQDIQIQEKSDKSPLTIADQKSNEIIVAGLNQLAINYPIVSEENKTIPYEERVKFNRFWMVDPLDGTKEFIKRNGEFTVNIALIDNGIPILGVVYAPALDLMYWAVKEIGAYKVVQEEDVGIFASHFSAVDTALRIVCSRSHMNEETKAFVGQLAKPVLVPTGSSLKIVYLAEGKADIYPRLGPTMEWDIAAAQIILEEAGGSVKEAEKLQNMTYNKENMLNPYFVAYGQGDISSLFLPEISE
ncbi:MAG: 3'(2'),5'-bisphosphate nucleotidase CysQ [Bacteroidia bacterium]|nr:3'(2'),5'-bisphosphate nucleotidase CysQ [Bacteroidia bacterium]